MTMDHLVAVDTGQQLVYTHTSIYYINVSRMKLYWTRDKYLGNFSVVSGLISEGQGVGRIHCCEKHVKNSNPLVWSIISN